jgi:hypothetical protein
VRERQLLFERWLILCAKCDGLVYRGRHQTAWRAKIARSIGALERKGKSR